MTPYPQEPSLVPKEGELGSMPADGDGHKGQQLSQQRSERRHRKAGAAAGRRHITAPPLSAAALPAPPQLAHRPACRQSG